jgi:hypothetical protein
LIARGQHIYVNRVLFAHRAGTLAMTMKIGRGCYVVEAIDHNRKSRPI